MAIPEGNENVEVTQLHVASQHGAAKPMLQVQQRPVERLRSPHPLPLFLAHVAKTCGDDRARLARVLAGLRRYQDAPVAAPRPQRPVIGQSGGVMLRDFGGHGPVVVMVPSLINPPSVLDLADGNSLMDGLARRGLRALLVDWGETEPEGLESLIESRLVPLLSGLGEAVALAGYCLGGTLALGAAALLGDRVTRLALLATPWHFSGYDDAARDGFARWWHSARSLAASMGALPMDLLQPAFWELDSATLAAKYEKFAMLPEGAETAAFAALEDWSNTGQPLSLAAARGVAEDLFAADLPGRGEWHIAGRTIDPARLGIPILDIIASRDRIVPPGAALSTGGTGTPLALDAGHVGMVVGGRAPRLLWDPLAEWLRA